MSPRRRTILVVDEDAASRRRVRDDLGGGYQVLEAETPTKALALALERYPDCILVDLDLPGLSGVELCATLADLNQTKLIPVIAISKHSAARPDEVRKALGVAGFLPKPVDPGELEECIATVLASQRSERRREIRVHLAVALRIVGTDEGGREFDVVLTTHDVSTNGFSCKTTLPLAIGHSLETWMILADKTKSGGRAVVVRVEKHGTPDQRYAFQFIQKPDTWILQ